jgi:hypothetical protein
MAMSDRTKHIIASALVCAGTLFLILNAADYVMRWNQINSSISAIGLGLVVIGGALARKKTPPI